MRRALLGALAIAAVGCGDYASDLHPPTQRPADPVRVATAGRVDPAVVRGIEEAVAALPAARTPAAEAEVILATDPQEALAAARRHADTPVALLGETDILEPPQTMLVLLVDFPEIPFLAGALAGVAGERAVDLRVDGLDAVHADAVGAGGRAAGTELAVRVVPCGRASRAGVVVELRVDCGGPVAAGAWSIAPRRLPGARPLGTLGMHLDAVAFAAIRAVQAGDFRGGETELVGLREHALGFRALSPTLSPAQVDRLQHIQDDLRAGEADVPPLPDPG
jgi:hypothetical protein